MKTEKILDTWKKIDSEVKPKTKEEMEQILSNKVKRTVNKFAVLIIIDLVCSIGLTTFLIITSLNRMNDTYYLINNISLGLIVIAAMITSIWSLKKLHEGKFYPTLKEQLEQRIELLSKWLNGEYKWIYIVITPIILLMVLISIHVYYEYMPLVDVLKNDDSLFGMLFGFPIGLFVAYFTIQKIRKHQLVYLKNLKELHNALEN
jgi:di/tricarboxylate transporter